MTSAGILERPGVVRGQLSPDDRRRQFKLDAGTKLLEFVLSDNSFDFICGPLGSGKTHGLFARLMRHAQQQRQSTLDGLRKTRWAVVRSTYPDLKRSTIRTWNEIAPEEVYGKMNWSLPPSHRLKFPLGDGTFVQSELDFLALDKPEDIRKLRSTEYTGIVFNEMQYTFKEIVDEADSRLRYPPKSEGGATWRGIFGDLNAPDEDHWIAIMRGMVDLPAGMTDDESLALGKWPDEWGFYLQPPALIEKFDQHGRVTGYEVNPHAENISNLDDDYYSKQIIGKSKAWIDSRLMVRVVLVVDGSPVWPMFRTEVHTSNDVLRPIQGHEVVVGVDFGRTAGAVFMQPINNRVLVQHELLWTNTSTVDSAPMVKRFLAKYYEGCPVRAYGDPKGQDKGQNDDRTGYEIYAANGIDVRAPPDLKQNMISTRIDAVANLLNEMESGRPRFVLSPMCRTLKVAMAGRYHNKKDETGELKPSKDRYSHIADALQYACIGIGEGRRMIGRSLPGDARVVQVYKRKTMRRISA